MAILTRGWMAAGAATALLAGCAMLAWTGAPERPAFPHALHGADLGLDCEICHPGATTAADAERPPSESCQLCHDGIDPDKPVAQRAAALFTPEGAYRAAPISRLDPEVRFAHDRHARAGVHCTACHGDVAGTSTVPASVRVEKAACLRCHTEQRVRDDCTTCHTHWDRTVAPPTHVAGWREEGHGCPVRGGSTALVDRCSLCHTESSCTACHATEPPRSHTNHFRHVGHGLVASLDRESCTTCHRTDSCTSCHQQTAPRSHVAGFGGTKSSHCISCHEGESPTHRCSTCHQGTPSHTLATPLPAGTHSPALNCRQCHGAGQPLPHPDNGSACTDCHK